MLLIPKINAKIIYINDGSYDFNGFNVTPSFELIAKELLSDTYKPSAVSSKTDIEDWIFCKNDHRCLVFWSAMAWASQASLVEVKSHLIVEVGFFTEGE